MAVRGQDWEGRIAGSIPVWATPSSGLGQRMQRADAYTLAPEPPCCRILDLGADGALETTVLKVFEARPEFRCELENLTPRAWLLFSHELG